MVARGWLVGVVILGAFASLGAQYRSKNFVVEAATQPIAQRVAEWAEHYRKEKAVQWLGQQMPDWGQPCPLRVSVSYNGSGGATTFSFDRGRILSIQMQIEGTLERLLASVLPHEVTHTVLAYRFRQPVPRWADEGGSVLSEDDQERARHDQLVRQILRTPGRAIPLRRLFTLTQYPRDVMVLYAEGYSVTNFLVRKSNRAAFLNFVGDGMRQGWDSAVRTHYGYRNVDELEQAWVQSLRESNGSGDTAVARGKNDGNFSKTAGQGRAMVRRTLPPAMPVLGAPQPVQPVFRGPPPEEETTSPMKPAPSAAPAGATRPQTPPPVRLVAPRPYRPGEQQGWDSRKPR